MGQYYNPTIIKERKVGCKMDIVAWFYAHGYHNGLKLMEHSYKNNELVNAVRNWLIANEGGRLVWAGDYADGEDGENSSNIYCYANELPSASINAETKPEYHYYNNHDKKQFVDLDKYDKPDRWGFIIEPLPLLTAEGNGRGGGDYIGTDMDSVGLWARDFITCDTHSMEGYTEITPHYEEK